MTDTKRLGITDIKHLVEEAYIPFADINRAIIWPTTDRFENDAEHSFSLALIGVAAGSTLGLDVGKLALYGTIHDLVERYAGDTSIWDEEGKKTKGAREAEALETIKKEFAKTPILAEAIEEYEQGTDEEALFIYALDKVIPGIIAMAGNGEFWKRNDITYDMFLKKEEELRPKIAKHKVVLQWNDELLVEIDNKKASLFAK